MPAYPLPQVQPLSRRALRRLDKALFTEDAADQALNCRIGLLAGECDPFGKAA
jgi:hypothetical protein